MKYNLITVSNSEYFPFAELFITSLYENINLNNLDKIFIFDTGLTYSERNFLESFSRVEIKETDIVAPFDEVHGENWGKNVYSKTKFLLSTLEETNTPTLMIDIDCVFQRDFFHLLEGDEDVLACSRSREGFSTYIGSFFVAKNIDASKKFLDNWIEEISQGEEQFKESFALSRAVHRTAAPFLGVNCKVGAIGEDLVSNLSYSPDACILHLKSDPERDTIEKRICSYRIISEE